jgi:CRISPR-associated protein Cas2
MLVRYLVGYDIADSGRLRRVHQACKGYGTRLQYSLFTCDLSARGRIELERDLTALMHHREDRVMIVRLGPIGTDAARAIEFFGLGEGISDEPDIVIV